jgi:hypothetical protein
MLFSIGSSSSRLTLPFDSWSDSYVARNTASNRVENWEVNELFSSCQYKISLLIVGSNL